jgi:hypothetical protein
MFPFAEGLRLVALCLPNRWMKGALPMLTILNRAEVFITRDLDDLNRVRNLLAENQIDHMVRTNSITNPGRHHGVPNIRAAYAYQYRVFVHKRNLDPAKRLIHK